MSCEATQECLAVRGVAALHHSPPPGSISLRDAPWRVNLFTPSALPRANAVNRARSLAARFTAG